MCALSSTVQVIGPQWSSDHESGASPRRLTRPYVGLSPTRPQSDAGFLIDPAVSSPSAPRHNPAATAAPGPVLDPPVMRDVSHGFFGAGTSPGRLDIVSLPRMTVPALRRRSTAAASRGDFAFFPRISAGAFLRSS